MEPLLIEPSKSTPLVDFDSGKNVLRIAGESYPENAAKFFSPIFTWVKEFLLSDAATRVVVEMEMRYFNSSSSKAFMNLFELFEAAAKAGKEIVINWRYHEEDETALEAGEEFMEEVPSASFNLVEIPEE
jgi:hypothetical protein